MSESNNKDNVAQDQEDSGAEHVSAEPESEVAETASTFVNHACRVVLHSDEYFHEDKSASLQLGLINFAIFLGTIFLYQFFLQVTRLSSWSFKFAHVTSGIRSLLAIGVPLVLAAYVLRWRAGKRDDAPASLAFFVERVGAILIIPSLLLVVATLLKILNINLYAWFRGAEQALVYAGIFLLSYLHADKSRIANAAIFTVGFYFAYRLMLLLI